MGEQTHELSGGGGANTRVKWWGRERSYGTREEGSPVALLLRVK